MQQRYIQFKFFYEIKKIQKRQSSLSFPEAKNRGRFKSYDTQMRESVDGQCKYLINFIIKTDLISIKKFDTTMRLIIYILKHINYMLLISFSDKKLREERRDLCFVELEGEDNFSNYALYFFPFIGYFGRNLYNPGSHTECKKVLKSLIMFVINHGS